MINYTICICTYKRTHLLKLLLEDISSQSSQPGSVIIVDGYADSGEVREMLCSCIWPSEWNVYYLPSNNSNLPYQRYLGWRIAKEIDTDYLLYFDDDLRIKGQDVLSQLLEPMLQDLEVVGVSADTSNGAKGKLSTEPLLLSNSQECKKNFLVEKFGSGRNTKLGELTPSGHRKFPERKQTGYVETKWLQGRVMLYRMSAITQDCFSDDLFALDHIRCDLGEDTYLSRQVGINGKLLFGFGLGIEHPNADLPKCYPIEAKKFGYARAYSRRFLNDHYRVTEPPKFADRFALAKSYLGNSFLNWWQVLSIRKDYQLSYAWGYSLGAIRGIFQKPTAKNLTPGIDWWKDAEEALIKNVIIQARL